MQKNKERLMAALGLTEKDFEPKDRNADITDAICELAEMMAEQEDAIIEIAEIIGE